MDTYQITIQETLSTTIEVEAESPSLAVSEAEDEYNAQNIVLSADHHAGTDIALSIDDKLCRTYLENPLFLEFVDAKLRKILPELDSEGKVRLAFGSPDNAISEFETYGNQPVSNNVCLLYTCNAWHEHSSRELVAPFSSKELVYNHLDKNRKKYNLSDWDLEFFKEQGQTQCRNRNFILDCRELDPVSEIEDMNVPFYSKVFSCGETRLTRRELEEFPYPLFTKNVSDEQMQAIVSEMDKEIKKWTYDDANEDYEFKYEDIRLREMEEAAVRHKVRYYQDLE